MSQIKRLYTQMCGGDETVLVSDVMRICEPVMVAHAAQTRYAEFMDLIESAKEKP